MTDDLIKEIIIGSVAAIASAVFSGIPAAVLVWWTWKRDQENVIVRKVIGPIGEEPDVRAPYLKVRVINRSLFPVHVANVGFEIDGQDYRPSRRYFPATTDARAYTRVDSGDSLDVTIADLEDLARFRSAVRDAAIKYKCSADALAQSSKVIAVAILESNRVFRSALPLWLRTWRKLRQIKREMDAPSGHYPELEESE